MGEAKTKSQAWTGSVPTLTRWAIAEAMDWKDRLVCQKCGAGRLAFDGDPQKVTKWNRLWNALDLTALDGLSLSDLRALVDGQAGQANNLDPKLAQPLAVTLDNDLVRFLLTDILATRARFSVGTGVIVYLPLAKALLAYARDASMRLRERTAEELAEADDCRVIALSEAERKTAWELLNKVAPCGNSFPTRDGGTFGCPFPADGPRDLRQLEEWCRMVEQLRLGAAFEGNEPEFGDAPEQAEYQLDLASAKTLLAVLVGRVNGIPRGPLKLAKMIADLDAIKNGGGKPLRG